jgi:hypothetical protein
VLDGIDRAFSVDSETSDRSPYTPLVRAVKDACIWRSDHEERQRAGSEVVRELVRSTLALVQPNSALREGWTFTVE